MQSVSIKLGYQQRDPFGQYGEDVYSCFYGKDLALMSDHVSPVSTVTEPDPSDMNTGVQTTRAYRIHLPIAEVDHDAVLTAIKSYSA